MKSKRKTMVLVGLIALWMSGCQLQEVIEQGALNNWFWSRFAWSALVTFLLGIVAAKLLCRLQIRAPFLDCIRTARTRFMLYAGLLALVMVPLFLWFDALVTQPFGEGNELAGWKVFSLVILDWGMLVLMAWAAFIFYLTVAIFTRFFFARTCNCKFAFFPKAGR